MEGGTKCVANDLKDKTITTLDRRSQDGMMPLTQSLPLVRILLSQLGAAFDIREEESDSAGRETIQVLLLVIGNKIPPT
jgi:hypothetical protein